MGKQQFKSSARLRKRLLIIFISFFVFQNLICQVNQISNRQLQELRIEPVENQSMFINTDIKFQIIIPNVESGIIQVNSPTLPNEISFKTLRKTPYYQEQNGTLIELWFTFSEKGTYTIPDLPIVIFGRERRIKFTSVTISVNPKDCNPRIVLSFDSKKTIYSDTVNYEENVYSVKAGEKVRFNLNLQYAVQLVQLSCDIPKDSIFSQIETYEMIEVKQREKTYSDDIIPVASYEWIFLQEGKTYLPNLKLSVTGYNGRKFELSMPPCFVNVLPSQKKSVVTNTNGAIFDDAFNKSYSTNQQIEYLEITEEDVQKLAELRKKERNSFIDYSHNLKQRVNFEELFGLPTNEKEYPVVIFYVSLIFIVLFVVFVILFIKKKKYIRFGLSLLLLLCSLSFSIYSFLQITKVYAICNGGELYSIPEESAESKTYVFRGKRIRVLEKNNSWCYIEFGNIGGWIKGEKLIFYGYE
jgi:hypothetical protein